MPPASDHFDLIRACCIHFVHGGVGAGGGGGTGREEIAARVAEVADWEGLVRAAALHGVAPLVAREAVSVAGDAIRADGRDILRHAERRAALNGLAAVQQMAGLARGFEEAGVAALPYKGPLLALDAYGDVAMREYLDLDFVVPPADVERAVAVLAQAGYSPAGRQDWRAARFGNEWTAQVSFTCPGGALPVELHWRFCDLKLPWNPDVTAVFARARERGLAGARVRIPSREDQLLLVLLHAARHAWDRLDAFACAGALLAGGVDAPELIERAASVGGTRALLVGMAAASRLIGVALPAEIRAGIAADRAVAPLAADAEARARRGGGDARRQARLHLALLSSAGARARYLSLAAITPTAADVEAVPLPGALRFFYPVVRVARIALRGVARR
ncbi:MAG: nucleotidyltransferase family protein [Gemmatimonadaceae bacterium]|nr:nucleotidyltransferase family protein [Gemmatimonadaceae bacterium]